MIDEEKTHEIIYVTTGLHLSLGDRIRVLFGWEPTVRNEVYYNWETGESHSESSVSLKSPFPQKPKVEGFAEFEASPEDKGK